MQKKLNKKAGTPLVIGIFVVGVFALLTFALFTFATRQEAKNLQIQTPQVLEETYAKEALINSYISDLVKKSAEETTNSDAQTFLDNFENNLNSLGLQNIIPETKDIPLQLDSSIVEIENDQVSIKLKFKIDNYAYSEKRELVHVEYIYEKTFSSELGSEENEES